MDNLQLSSTVLNLKQRLSKDDREQLELYLRRDVPRRAGDDLTLSGNLKLIQTYLDKDKINEKGFNLLIDAFKQIQCSDAVNLLKEHQQRMISSGIKESTQGLASIMVSNVEQDQQNSPDDTYVTMDDFDKHVNYHTVALNNNDRIIDDKKIIAFQEAKEKTYSRKPCSCVPLLKKKCLIMSMILFILLAISVGLNIAFSGRKTDKIVESTTLVKAGRKFGGDGGEIFDDSKLPMFTYYHYLSGFACNSMFGLDGCQFNYTSSDGNKSRVESIRGNSGNKTDSTHKYNLNPQERIKEVRVISYGVQFVKNGPTEKIIRGLQFVTTNNTIIPQNVPSTGSQDDSESFPGYTLGYVTGKSSDKRIDQLQFFWYRTESDLEQQSSNEA
jgi:hypothetical protein